MANVINVKQVSNVAQQRLLYASHAMKNVARHVAVIASSPVSVVLITGESGTGKALIARMLHGRSGRSARPFVELNVSTLPEGIIESELFGYERGAFSDARERKLGLAEVADGGTLFLDEIGDLTPAAQAKLLTFLEQRSFRRVGGTRLHHADVRIVAATNRDLPAMVAERSFREDLWYRLNPMTIHLPPLRERCGDVELLAERFLRQSSEGFGRRWRGITREALGVLSTYRWPGNVRELKGVIAKAVLLADGELLGVEHLPPEVVRDALAVPDLLSVREDGTPEGTVLLAERMLVHIRKVVDICGGNQTLAAQHLGITRQTLARKLKLVPRDDDAGHSHDSM